MRLIVGLGNPGKEYAATRHNLGFMVLDRLVQIGAGEWTINDWRLDREFEAELAEVRHGAERHLLVKPQTYMNNSGRSVERLRHYYNLNPAAVVVVHDELALPLGSIRIRQGGQAAGHNGVGSLIHHLGTDGFWRVRCGIEQTAAERPYGTQSDFVLSRFSADESDRVRTVVDQAASYLVHSAIIGELDETTLDVEP